MLEWVFGPQEVPIVLATDIAAGWAFFVAGAVASGGSRPRLVAALFELVGVAWLLGALAPSILDLYRGPLVHLLLVFPTGRFSGRLPRVVSVAGYLDGVLGQIPVVRAVSPVLWVIVGIVVVNTALGESGSRVRGRASAAIASGVIAATASVFAVGTVIGPIDPDSGRWAYAVALGATALLLAGDLRWGGWSREAVARVVIRLGDSDEPATLRALVADALGDQSILIGYAAGSPGQFVSDIGLPVDLPGPGSGRSASPLMVGRDQIGVLIRDEATETDVALVDGVAAAAQLALGNARLNADARGRLQALAASRRRLIQSEDAERSRINRQLESGVGRRLASVESILSTVADDDPSSESRELVSEVRGVRADLAELTAGIGSGSLLAEGLGPAVNRLAMRSRIPIEIDIPSARFPFAIERTAFFLCSEGLANSIKYAHASRISIRILREPSSLSLEILDNGVGGAHAASGSGLAGLADRVDALGGTFSVGNGPEGGTRLFALLPLGVPGEPGDATSL